MLAPGVERKIFAMLHRERLVVKLPAARCAELVAAGDAEPFETAGRRMREWVALTPRTSSEALETVVAALEYVRP